MAEEIYLGDIAKDDLTSFEGVVVQRTFWLSNCDRITLQPKGLREGKVQENASFDITHCLLVKRGAHERSIPAGDQREELALGDTVREEITEFAGVIVGRVKFLCGSDRLCLQPKSLDKDGQPQKQYWVDVAHCVLVSKLQPPAPKETRGGPMPSAQRHSDPVRR
jgi:hypothetical protein